MGLFRRTAPEKRTVPAFSPEEDAELTFWALATDSEVMAIAQGVGNPEHERACRALSHLDPHTVTAAAIARAEARRLSNDDTNL